MGRRVLLIGAGGTAVGARARARLATLVIAATAIACGTPQVQQPRAPDDAHADVACSTCHAGALADARSAAVPAETCTASGCHADAGPQQVRLGSVEFTHRGHAGDSVVTMACAGCHTHAAGNEPLTADVDACSLCHLSQQAAGQTGECRTCHGRPAHVALASQGVEIPHQGLPWIEGGCVRCHYDVTEPPVDVALASCATCHASLDDAVARGIGEDLHGPHAGAACTSCHVEGTHRIRAMSSAVDLQCTDCHARAHALEVAPLFPSPDACTDCHTDVHQSQQRLVLGLVTELEAPAPSEKFMAGLTCRSCHAAAPGTGPEAVLNEASARRASAPACVSCHRTEYATVLRWWTEGDRSRVEATSRFVEAGVRALSGGSSPTDSLSAELEEARRLVALVREGRGVHNLPLSHRLLQEATDRVAAAYQARGLGVPATPALGRQPRMGLCSYCHYRSDDPWLFQEMSGEFHDEVLRIR
jgi:hypothetical protein